jgi:sulfur carrier protein
VQTVYVRRTLRIRLNGKSRDVEVGATIAQLVESLGFGRRQVVVEHNGEAVERARFDDVVLEDEDVVEVVRPVQGGSS